MSYDISMYIDTGGHEPAFVCEIGNYTSNVAGMWYQALGYSLRDIHGKTGLEIRSDIVRAIDNIQNPDTRHEYRAMNPENGWGTVKGAQEYLQKILEACDKHPKATFSVYA